MNNKQRAEAVYASIKKFLDEQGFKYDFNDESNTVKLTVTGEDFPITLYFTVSEEKQRVETFSNLTFEVKPEKIIDLAMAMSYINGRVWGGKFSIDFAENNNVIYDDSTFFAGLEGFNSDYAKDIVSTAYTIIEGYNDQLYAINKGLISVKDFMLKNQ